MRIKNKKIIFITACYLAAFAVIGAGFAYCVHLSEKRYEKLKISHGYSTLSDAAAHLEALASDLSFLAAGSDGERKSRLADIRTDAELAASDFGRISFETDAGGYLLSFLSVCSEAAHRELNSDNAAVNPELVSALAEHAFKIESVLPSSTDGIPRFEAKINDIFGRSELDVLLSEQGYGASGVSNGFRTLAGGEITADDACRIARNVLGRNARLYAEEADAAVPIYSVGGKNISALISKKGGFLLQFLFDLDTGEKRITETEAQEIAEQFLSEKVLSSGGFAMFSSTYADGVYAYGFHSANDDGSENEREIIRIGVSHGSGRIVLFDALEYYRYHINK